MDIFESVIENLISSIKNKKSIGFCTGLCESLKILWNKQQDEIVELEFITDHLQYDYDELKLQFEKLENKTKSKKTQNNIKLKRRLIKCQ